MVAIFQKFQLTPAFKLGVRKSKIKMGFSPEYIQIVKYNKTIKQENTK